MKHGLRRRAACMVATILIAGALPAMSDVRTQELDWSGPGIRIIEEDVVATEETFEGHPALNVTFEPGILPHVMFRSTEGVWNWEDWGVLEVEVYNTGQEPLMVSVRVDGRDAPRHNTLTAEVEAMPGEWTQIRTTLHPQEERFWGLRGLPGIEKERIRAFQVFLTRPEESHELLIGTMRLLGGGEYDAEPMELPFIDQFGQFKHDDWPGKIRSMEELHAARDAEADALATAPSIPNQDDMGGWIDGPQLEATGWFRTELVDGKWWLVTPEGRLFLSLGVTCVATFERTYVEGRDGWFDWLPDQDDPDFEDYYEVLGPNHSMAEAIGGTGLAFGFYNANQVHKFGSDWEPHWRKTALNRLHAWGFNTIAAWSNEDLLAETPIPYTAKANATSGVRPIAAGRGYWGRMADVFDPDFPRIAEENIAPTAQEHADNPLCIGFYVDNELGWGDVRAHTLASPPDQPARQYLISTLQEKYPSIDVLNAAWGTDAECWDTLDRPETETRAAKADLDDYVYAFSTRYFQTIREILSRLAPNHLYLGSRYAGPPEEAAFRACAENVDVISLNLYYVTIDPEEWNLERTYGKPAIIGEFHFGAHDRGMFHTGLQYAANQKDRAARYVDYVHSIATNPAFVGCHWFQYADSPVTGRWYDGENYNIGLVSVADVPYKELIEAATEIHTKAYDIRSAAE